MKEYSVKRKFGIAIGWLLVAACMGVIFYLSHQPADESSRQSMAVIGFLGKLVEGIVALVGHEGFRTVAHGLEYCGLAVLIYHAMLQTTGKSKPLFSLAATAVYALSDEIHQIFIPGRAFQLMDIAVDTAGAAIGIAACVVLFVIVMKLRGKSVEKKR